MSPLKEPFVSYPAVSVTVVPLEPAHAAQVREIYQAGIDEGHATFETIAPTWDVFDAGKLPEHRFAALDEDGNLLGWAAVSRVSERSAYAGVVEHSVYVHPRARGRGVASVLLTTLINSTEAAGIWTLQAGIFPENSASLALHRRAGFRVIGTRERIGRHHGAWRDVMLLERRSPAVT
ncbi:GNAT family N-acetyltransferase [Streptomyces sp. NPDC091272]|uniref:GNAT family N-acetyltransferase n=1 Tax=Streptomyces sp. NPDC091272 TaxID=3365981 RepID=UPI00382DDE03